MSSVIEELRSGAQYGIIGAFRTGNPVIDMTLACLIPVIISQIIQYLPIARLQQFFAELFDLLLSRNASFTRVIRHRLGYRDERGLEERNQLLVKAISLYIGQLNIQYKQAECSLMAIKEAVSYDRYDYCYKYGSTAKQLGCYSTVVKSDERVWCTVREGVDFMTYEETKEHGSGENAVVQREIVYEFRSNLIDGDKQIDKFIKDAFEWYKGQIEKSTDDSKYMYIMNKSKSGESGDDGGGGGNDESTISSRRYKLSNRKTFQSLFFPEKDNLMGLLDKFATKTGKYAIPGYPHKIGLLLHGPPGTGKTSLIKAIAAKMNRNVISVPLAKIETNQQLMNIMFDMKFKVPDEDLPVKLSFDDTIFVMEDIDCASRVVHRRTPAATQPTSSSENGDSPTPSMDDDTTTQESDESIVDSDEADKAGMGLISMLLNSTMTGGSTKGVIGCENKTTFLSSVDKLNLQGILEVLDGVIDADGRIVIMTTNHPEKLDPALIRPGRIDKILELGYVGPECVIDMIKLYFGGKCDFSKEIYEMFSNAKTKLTPAQVEQLAAEHDEQAEFVQELQSALHEFKYSHSTFAL